MNWLPLDPKTADLVAPRASSQVVFARGDQAVIRVTGKHRGRFLQALMTQDIDQDRTGDIARTCLCTAQGKLIALATSVVTADAILLVTLAETAQPLIDGLLRYRVAERVKLAVDPDVSVVTSLNGTPAADFDPVAEWPQESSAGVLNHGIVATEKLPSLLAQATEDEYAIGDTAAWHAARINHGISDVGLDFDDGSTPLELGMRDAVSYSKGCYLGQEAIAMMTYRGKLRRHLCWTQADDVDDAAAAALVVGTKIRSAQTGKRAGSLASGYIVDGVARGLALINRRTFEPGAKIAIPRSDGADPLVAQIIDATVPDVFAGEDA